MSSKVPLTADECRELSELLFPSSQTLPTLEDLARRYPPRVLPKGAKVVRVAPSPTGNPHIGALYMGLFNRIIATRTGGVFIVRIEDTDEKREVEGSFEALGRMYVDYNILPDEGVMSDQNGTIIEKGAYGPYAQSARREVYQAVCRSLVATGKAYPCFCTEPELTKTTELQQAQKVRTGYYGRFAKWRDAPLTEVRARLAEKAAWVIRIRSTGDGVRRISWVDGVKGEISMPENDLDVVVLKSDGQSLYHLAHLVDDHYMGVTDVIRADEWVSSVPLHLQLWQLLGWSAPTYNHPSPLCKIELITEVDEATGKEVTRERKRKLSKRKDPDAGMDFYTKAGYPVAAVAEYLLNIANSDFEDWRKKNPQTSITEFDLRLAKVSPAGALTDEVKLTSIGREVVGRLPLETVFSEALRWAKLYDTSLATLMEKHAEYSKRALNIEREGAKGSKRVACWSDIRGQLAWFFDEEFANVKEFPFPEHVTPTDRAVAIEGFLETWSCGDAKDVWFAKCKEAAKKLGFASEMKEWKANPSAFKGSIGDFTMILRVAVSGLKQTPDLCEVMQVMGESRVKARLTVWIKNAH